MNFNDLKIGGLYIIFPVPMIVRDWSHDRKGIIINQDSFDEENKRIELELSQYSNFINFGDIIISSYISKTIDDSSPSNSNGEFFSCYEPFLILEKHGNYNEKLDKLFILRTVDGDSVMGYLDVYHNNTLYPLIKNVIYEIASDGK